MINTRFYPKFIRDVITNIPTICFETIQWNEFVTSSAKILKQYLRGKPDKKILSALTYYIPDSLELHQKLKGKYYSEKVGESTLRLFFAQFKNEQGFFLDMRQVHFHQAGEITHFSTNALYHRFEDKFRLNLIKLYKGFYYCDDEMFEHSMHQLGMTQGLTSDEIITLKELYNDNFGQKTGRVIFNLAEFQASFLKIFQFFLEHKVKLQTDFIYLGFYLVTLYMHLEKYPNGVDAGFDVEKIFKEAFPTIDS
jgi:hypothetical protein